MPFLPARDNDYRGSRFAIWFIWLQITINTLRGGVHVFWDDSGAGRIAGLDLTQNGAAIVSLLAAIGVDQLAWGVTELGVVLRYRRWIPPLLAILLAKQVLAVLLLWHWKPLPVEAPGKIGALITLPLMALALWLSLRERPVSAPRS